MDSSLSTADMLRAAAQGDESLVKSLMQQGADALYQANLHSIFCLTMLSLKYRDHSFTRITATRCACKSTEHEQIAHATSTIRVCKPFFDTLSSLQDERGRNALMEAAAGGHDSIVTMLLEAGTPWNAIDKEGSCAGDLAVAAGHDSTAEMLLEAGGTHFLKRRLLLSSSPCYS